MANYNVFQSDVGSLVAPKFIKQKGVKDAAKFPTLLLEKLMKKSMLKMTGSQDARVSVRVKDNPTVVLTSSSDKFSTNTRQTLATAIAPMTIFVSNKFIPDADRNAVKGESAIADLYLQKKKELDNDLMKGISDSLWSSNSSPTNLTSIATIVSDNPSAQGTVLGIDSNTQTSYGFKTWQNIAFTASLTDGADLAAKVSLAKQWCGRTGASTEDMILVAGSNAWSSLVKYSASLGRNMGVDFRVLGGNKLMVDGMELMYDVAAPVDSNKIYLINPESLILAFWGDDLFNYKEVGAISMLGSELILNSQLALLTNDRSMNAVITGY